MCSIMNKARWISTFTFSFFKMYSFTKYIRYSKIIMYEQVRRFNKKKTYLFDMWKTYWINSLTVFYLGSSVAGVLKTHNNAIIILFGYFYDPISYLNRPIKQQ